MPHFRYIARTQSGEKVQGTLSALDRRSAANQIARMNTVPISLEETTPEAAPATAARATAAARARNPLSTGAIPGAGGRRTPRMNARERLLFTRELSDLLASGMTLGDALHALARGGDKKKSLSDELVTDLRDRIVQGQSLSQAMQEYPRTFPALYVSVIRSGEASGALTDTLVRLAEHFERAQETRERIITAITYPSIVLGFGVIMMIFMSIFVIPKFANIFEELGSTLPAPTRLLMSISRWMTGFRGLAVLVAILATTGLTLRQIRTETGRLWWHRQQLRLPILRQVISANAFAQFARTLGSLLQNGVPILQALSIVEDTMGNVVLAREIREARDRVTDGSTISGPLAQGNRFPRILTDMLAVGERSGDLPGALGHIARRYENERDRAMRLFLTVLEPVMILVIALMVGFVAVSMLMAVFQMSSGM